MQTLRLFIAVAPLAVVVLAQETTSNANYGTVGPAFTGDNIGLVIKAVTTKAAPKSEFETTPAYEARRNASKMDGSAFVFVFDSQKDFFTYDADSATMMAPLPITTNKFYLEPNSPEYTVLTLRRLELSSREYVGSNAFGATVNVSSHLYDEYGVVTNQPLVTALAFPMEVSIAKDAKSYLRVALACTLLGGEVHRDVAGHEATISDPYETHVQKQYLPVTVTELFVFDERSGNVLLRVRPDNAADLARQREFMSKPFPIELAIRGSGMIYVTIDEGVETPAFQSTVVKAKHQVVLKVKTELDRFSFLLNGAPYRPVWSVHRNTFGSFSMFDYAQAVVSSANTLVSRDSQSGTSPYKVGETVQEWLATSKINIAAVCRENRSACKRLSEIQKKGRGEFWWTDASGHAIGWTFRDGKVVEVRPQ
jgi:hypothetical protein